MKKATVSYEWLYVVYGNGGMFPESFGTENREVLIEKVNIM